MSRKNRIIGLSEPEKKTEFLDIFKLMSISNFMLSSVEHEKCFITSGPDFYLVILQNLSSSTTNVKQVAHWRSRVTINIMEDEIAFNRREIPGEVYRHLR